MSDSLQSRAKAFVARTVPSDLDYMPGSIAERVITQYADEGKLEVDSEFAELIELTAMEAASTINGHNGAAREYMAESAAILEAIMEEMQAADERR